MNNEELMREALLLAKEAFDDGDVPVGCVIADPSGMIIGRGRNRREADHDATAHAEIEAIREACAAVGDWRLDDCTLAVSLEPCPMCAGAIINARIPKVLYGLKEKRSGSCGSVIDLFSEAYGHHPKVYPGILAEDSQALLQHFFEAARNTYDLE
ncbi:MAG: nucleoside deaminase [Oscillospiraceae bacterium]|nr:nucleoside deaminase [Oscillospiraceae bacterium]